jgi:hypothetical protein
VRAAEWNGLNASDLASTYRIPIAEGQYSFIVFVYLETAPLDLQLRQLIAQSGRYELARTFAVPDAGALGEYTRYEVWRRVSVGAA